MTQIQFHKGDFPLEQIGLETPDTKISREKVWDFAVGIALILLGALTLRISFDRDFLGRPLPQQYASIGRVEREQGLVRYQNRSSVVWHDVQAAPEPVLSGDLIFTGDDGQAVLRIDDSAVRIMPGSLVTVEPKNILKEMGLTAIAGTLLNPHRNSVGVVNIQKGKMVVRFGQPDRPLDIHALGESVRVTPSSGKPEVTVSVDPSNHEHPIHLAAEPGAKFEVREIQKPIASENLPPPLQISLQQEMPLDRANLSFVAHGKTETFPVELTWKNGSPEHTTKDHAHIRVDGKSPQTQEISFNDHKIAMSLAEGRYSWRIEFTREETKDSVQTPWRSFTVIALRAPTLESPSDQARLQGATDKETSVSLRWKNHDDSLLGEAEIQPIAGGKPIRINGDAKGAEWKLRPGEYQWRVRETLADHSSSSDWSDLRHFAIQAPKPIPSPTPAPTPTVIPPLSLRLPADQSRWELQSEIFFTWRAVKAARQYQIQISADPKFVSPMLDRVSKRNFLLFVPDRPGNYYWRVRILDKKREGAWTSPRQIRVQ